jgi:hypothetical protein
MWYDGIFPREENPYLTAKLGARKIEAGVCPPMPRISRGDIVLESLTKRI